MKEEEREEWCTDKGGDVLSVKIRDISTTFGCVIHVLEQAWSLDLFTAQDIMRLKDIVPECVSQY